MYIKWIYFKSFLKLSALIINVLAYLWIRDFGSHRVNNNNKMKSVEYSDSLTAGLLGNSFEYLQLQ